MQYWGQSELYITFLDKHISSDGFKVDHVAKNLDLDPHRDFNWMSTSVCDSTAT